ncbi:MAG: kelch repeat-containing protein [Kofleriaceae bacterium]|nr:kelch repeat-containing protein [Kofleriaceae bacterium]
MLPKAALALALAACSAPADMPDSDDAWFEGLPLPKPRLEPGVTALGQRMIVLGGFTEDLVITREVDAFDVFANRWEPVQPAPVAWTHANLGSAAATLYLLGGLEGPNFIPRGDSFALDLDIAGAQWRALEPIPPGLERGAAAVVVSPPHIFLLGGATLTGSVATCIDYNLSSNTWRRLPDLPSPRSHAAAMRRPDGTLIIAGGLAGLGSSTALDEVLELPLEGVAWRPRTRMPTRRGGCAYGNVFNQLVCAGGEVNGAAVPVTESYDPYSDQWTSLPNMLRPRAGTQGAVISGRLYVPGGSASLRFEPTDTVFVFQLLEALQ